MERRLYFIFGDILTCTVSGAVGGWLAHTGVPGDLSMFFAMFIGMFLGMLAGMLIGFCLAPLFGAMEIMLPASLAGMVAGMMIGMGQMMLHPSPEDASIGGALTGLACLLLTYLLQARLRGEAS